MPNSMWPMQQRFQISLNSVAKKLFSMIDPNLTAEVFLLGINQEASEESKSISFEPVECGLEAGDFKNVHKLAAQSGNGEKGGRKKKTDRSLDEVPDVESSHKGYVVAIQEILNSQPVSKKTAFYVSLPRQVGTHQVFVVLTLPSHVVARYLKLEKLEMQEGVPTSRSFIDSSIEVFLAECRNSLKDGQHSQKFTDRAPEELLRTAGRYFMMTIEKGIECKPGSGSLFDTFDNVSLLRYEGNDAVGKILLAKSGHENVVTTLRLSKPISLEDSRKVRKFLELSNHDYSVVSDGTQILGLGVMQGTYSAKQESLFCIDFKGHYKWDLIHDGNALLSVSYGLPKIQMEGIDRNYFSTIVEQVFPEISAPKTEQLWNITLRATQQKTGTMLVISDHAKQEAKRLSGQCFDLEPLLLTEELIPQITSIDGAVLLDHDCTCYAIGVILDGIVSGKHGDASRGARYNSAIRYYNTNQPQHAIMIVIVSEDGMIDLIPDLRLK